MEGAAAAARMVCAGGQDLSVVGMGRWVWGEEAEVRRGTERRCRCRIAPKSPC